MATNLRLRDDAAAALQERAERTGMSQQEILRRAVDLYLGLDAARSPAERAVPSENRRVRPGILPPRHPFLVADHLIELPPGMTTAELLDRADRI